MTGIRIFILFFFTYFQFSNFKIIVHLLSHAGLLGLSKRLLFAGATIIFLLVYLAFWSSNNHHTSSHNIIVASESSTIADNVDWDPKNLDEQVIHCDEQEVF